MNMLTKLFSMLAMALIIASGSAVDAKQAQIVTGDGTVIIITDDATEVRPSKAKSGPSRSGRLAVDAQQGKLNKSDERDRSKSVSWQWDKASNKSKIYLFVPYKMKHGFSYDLREHKKVSVKQDWFGDYNYAIKANGTGDEFKLLNNGTVDNSYPNSRR
jgi:hypothetical protein